LRHPIVLHNHVPGIQVPHGAGKTEQGFPEGEVHFMVQIISRTSKPVVMGLLELEKDIPRGDSGRLFTLPRKADLSIARHTLLYVTHELFFVWDDPLTLAVGAFSLKGLAFAVALGAGLLHLHNKSGSHLLVYHAHTPSPAGLTLLRGPVFSPAALTLRADNVPSDARTPLPAIVQVLQGHLYLHLSVRSLAAPTLLLTPTEKHIKRVHGTTPLPAFL